jgi:hypothetical protein
MQVQLVIQKLIKVQLSGLIEIYQLNG